MSAFDIAALLEEISPEEPCGEDLEFDPAFTELEIAAQGREEQQIGDTIVEAEEPDWAEVTEKALAVLTRSKDLRAALHLTIASLRREGFVGLERSLRLVRGYLEGYWDSVHPRLDPDDDNDPTMRVNILASLADEPTMLRRLRKTPFTDSRVIGRFGMRDIAVAKGQLPPPAEGEGTAADMATIEAAFQDTAPETLQATSDAVKESIDHVRQIEALVTDQVGAGLAPDLSGLVKLLREAGKVLQGRGGGEAEAETDADEADEKDAGAPAAAGARPAGVVVPGAINNPNDVLQMLEKICDYYARCEPSSPIPLLLNRAKRLVSKDFMTIMKDLAPDGVSQVASVGGIEEDD